MGEKREAVLSVQQIEEYRRMQLKASSAQKLADYYHSRRRRLEDEFAKLLGFEDRKDAKRQAFALQIYLSDRMVRAHNRHTTPTVGLEIPIESASVLVANRSSVSVYLGDEPDVRPRDGHTHRLEPGALIEFPPRGQRGLFMAADSKHPLQVYTLEHHKTIRITLFDPEE